ncbi:MAG: sensor histidine kinase [Myxococcota bacterium]
MARRRNIRSLSVPIALAATAVPLSVALLVGWTLVVSQNSALKGEVTQNIWLLVLGILSFVVVMGVLVMFSIFLAREILEVRRQDSFIDSVTHELKSPLASLKLCLETLAREGLDDQQRESLRRMMMDDVDRLSSFIDDVLQASRLSHDRVGVDVGQVDVAELVARCVENVSLRHKVSREVFEMDVEPGLTVSTDRAALDIVLKNLVDNAVKYSGDHVEITVRARRHDAGGVIIEVTDRGIGIPRKDLKRVFHRFYRVPGESVHTRRGTGLGLFVVSALVRNLGGRIEAQSEGAGHGTTMRVVLPPASAERSREDAPASIEPSAS